DVGAPKARSVVGNERVRFNHQTFPALGLLFAGEYFDKYYHAVEAKSWLDIADAAFKMQAKAFKAYEDCNGYQWLTLYHTMLYALARPDFTFFDNGNVRRCADFAILCMDNLGYQVTYGDTGAFTGWWSEMPFLRGALWRHRDGRYAWALNKKFEVSGRVALGQYVADVAGREPDDLIGAIAWSLDPYYYRTFGGPDAVPEDHAVDKVVFRNGFDPEDQYLLLDGLSNGGHKHLDGNSISRWTENGRIWLADADYILSLPKYHNGVLIFRDGQSQPIPGFVELEHIVDLPSFGASTTTYRNYAGVDWRRHILWLKGDCFLVADEMLARQDGDYSFRVVWNTIGEVTLTDNGLSILQDGQYASIAVTPECRLSLQDDAQYGKNWSGYKHIREPVVRVFKAIRDCRLNAGESVVLFSLLHASGPKPSGPRLVRVAENVVGVLGLDEPMLAGVGDDAGEFSIANDVSVSAAAGILTPSKAFVVGATRIQAFGQTVTFPDGADAEADISGGTALVIDPARTTVNAHAASIEWQTMPASPDAIRALIERAMASAPAVVRPTAAAVKIPRPLKRLWSYREKLDAYLLTANAGAFEAVDAGLRLSCSPEPLPANVFSGEPGRNTLDNILDGKVQGTENCVMWDDDQPVTIRLDFDNEYRVSRLVLKAWFATSSSKNKLFQLADLTVEASNDGFAGDVRTVIQFTDEEMHGNWGAPGHAPHTYEFADLDAKARSLRVRLRPRKGTAIYVAELEVWGDRPGLADQAAGAKRKRAPVHTFSAVTMADLDGDGVDEVIAGSTNGKVYALAADGRMLWDFDTGGAVNAVSCVDFDGDGKQAVVAGSMGATVTALSARGQRLWTFAVPYYKRTGHVRVVFAADLAGDGKQAAIVGADNWPFYALDVNGEEIWRYESVHGSTCGAAADVDADGKDEVIAGTEYYWWHVVRPDGKRLFSYSTRGGPHANAVTAAKLTDNGRGCAVFGGADGNVHAIGPDGKLLWLLNTGDEVTSVCSMDVDGDGLDEILAASMSFNVYAINASGKVVWRRDLSSEVSCLAAIPARGRPAVLAGTRDGGVYLLDAADGRVLAGSPGSSPILAIAPGRSDGGAPVAAVAAANGDLALLSAD
ncbi:MAG: PQQ-binding-like beta-propeller repeat protein, partial [Armatimonadota bacterium]